jgi:hypothetical protein
MRTRIWILCIGLLALCVLLLLLRTHQQVGTGSTQSGSSLPAEEAVSQRPQNPPEEPLKNPTLPKAPTASTPLALPPVASYDSNARYQQVLAFWQTPIDFYGKVIDENSNVISGARVGFQWIESPDDEYGHRASTESDSQGLFSLNGKHGTSLEVSASKEGYYTPGPGFESFAYALSGHFLPDPANPIVFHLRKKGRGEQLIHIAGIGLRTMRDFLLSGDGKATEVLLRDGRLAPEGQGDLRVEFWAGQPIEGAPWRITWRCRVRVPGGGLIQTEEEFPFLAPQTGYAESDEWAIDTTNWTEQVNKQYYVKLRDGRFGRVKLRIIGVPSRAYFRMESFLNPSGSRNLEPAN